MSQQELMPEPQSSQSSQESYQVQSQGKQSWYGSEMDVQPNNWSQRSRHHALPKSDHPSTFEDSLPLYSYPAQDQSTLTREPNPEPNAQWQQQAQAHDASTGRGSTTGTYQPYSQYNPQQQIPWWVQPQEHITDHSKWISFLLLALVLLVSLPVLCSIGTALVSVVVVFSLLPIILAFAPIVLFLLVPLIRVFSPENHYDRRRRDRYDRSWW